ncbi:MAG: outer membrane protein transport protein [Deltaproteobacteria bacterium]|nr:outer membrane protein transport protein [Deltaproteobacteria bacterium]
MTMSPRGSSRQSRSALAPHGAVRRALLGGATSFILAVVLFWTFPARAGGFTRATGIGARASGMGGGFAAVASDASAVFYNPAGLVTIPSDVLVGSELVFIIRKYQPSGGEMEKASTVPLPLPYAFGSARFLVGQGIHMALGLGIYASQGGAIEYKQRPITEGIVKSRVGLYEFVPAVALELSRRVHVGASLRIGLGFFSVNRGCGDLLSCNQGRMAQTFTVLDTMYGVGFGYALGILVEPFDGFTVGATYHSNINVTARGNGALHAGGATYDTSVRLPFPQSVRLGLAYRINPKWLVAFQADWVDNSSFQELFVDVKKVHLPRSLMTTQMDWVDSYAVHAGVEFQPLSWLQVRWGIVYDSSAIKLQYRSRDLEDAEKIGFDAGVSFLFGRWRIEASLDTMMGDVANGFKSVTVPQSALAPGKHYPGGAVYTHLAAGARF